MRMPLYAGLYSEEISLSLLLLLLCDLESSLIK